MAKGNVYKQYGVACGTKPNAISRPTNNVKRAVKQLADTVWAF